MAAPIQVLEVVQAGVESTRGTAVPATAILDMDPGGAILKRNPSIIRVRNAGSLATSHRNYPGRDAISVDIRGTWTFNWAPWWFNLFLGPLATGTGAGADKLWTFGSSVISDTADNLKSATLELGGRDTWPSEYQVMGCIGQKLSLAFRQDQPWTYQATLLGTAIAAQAKTGALSNVATIVDVLGTLTKVYIDTSSAFGTTQKVGSVVRGTIDIALGTNARYTLDGQRNPFRVAVTGPRKISARLEVEYDSQTDYTATHAATAQRVRVRATGPTLGGSTYNCQIDLPGVWDTWEEGLDGGVRTASVTLIGQYDATPAADINAAITNAAAALP